MFKTFKNPLAYLAKTKFRAFQDKPVDDFNLHFGYSNLFRICNFIYTWRPFRESSYIRALNTDSGWKCQNIFCQ